LMSCKQLDHGLEISLFRFQFDLAVDRFVISMLVAVKEINMATGGGGVEWNGYSELAARWKLDGRRQIVAVLVLIVDEYNEEARVRWFTPYPDRPALWSSDDAGQSLCTRRAFRGHDGCGIDPVVNQV